MEKISYKINDIRQAIPVVAIVLVLFSMSCKVGAQNDFDKVNESRDWKLQFSDPCKEDWQDNWFLDGQLATIEHSDKGMNFSAGPVNRNDAHHAVLWTKQSFNGDIKIEYNYTRTDSQLVNVNILYIQATGIGKDSFDVDISKWNDLKDCFHE